MGIASFLILLATPITCLFSHALFCRVSGFNKFPRQVLATLCAGLGAVVSLVLVFYFERERLGTRGLGALFSFIISLSLAHIYFHLFNMSETARRIRILIELHRGGLPLASGYGSDGLIDVRLARLVELRQIEHRGGRFYPRNSLLEFVALAMKAYENLIFPRRKGLQKGKAQKKEQ